MTAWVVILLAAILLMIVAGGAALALSSRRSYRAANQIVPGITTGAPAEWAGAHTAEARLHRRLRDAMRALHTHPRRDEPGFLDLRVGLEQQALAVDERLVAVAALPEGFRAEPLAAVGAAVAAVEGAVATLVMTMAPDAPRLERATAELTERLGYIERARLELERLHPSAPADSLARPEDPARKHAEPDVSS